MTNREYLTPDDFAAALENGISAKLLQYRFNQGWSKYRCINQKVQKHVSRKKWHDKLRENKISLSAFHYRVNVLKWTEEEAATRKIEHASFQRFWEQKGREYPPELIALAESNDISYDTLRKRIKSKKMDPYEAATKPLQFKRRKKGEAKRSS